MSDTLRGKYQNLMDRFHVNLYRSPFEIRTHEEVLVF